MSVVARVREELERARKDRAVKAVVLRIQQPGGGVTASDTLYHEIRKYRQDTGVKVIAHLMDLGTSAPTIRPSPRTRSLHSPRR